MQNSLLAPGKLRALLEPGSNSVVFECGTWQSTGPLFNQVFVKLCAVWVGFRGGARDTQDVRYLAHIGTEPMLSLSTRGGHFKGCRL